MPPKTRGNKAIKTLKENIDVVQKTKPKVVSKVGKPPRIALADKTNSASDDNASMEAPMAQKTVAIKISSQLGPENPPKSRRERRLPCRYLEMGNKVLKTLSNDKNDKESQFVIANAVSKPKINQQSNPNNQTPRKNSPISTSETPQDIFECSLVANRPKRICRLPSKFNDHAISPSKNLVVQPCNASTPILQNKQSLITNVKDKKNKHNLISNVNKEVSKKSIQKRHIEDSSDSNNNAKGRLRRNREVMLPENPVPVERKISPKEKINLRPEANTRVNKKLHERSLSFRVLEDRKKSSKRDASNIDIYEFTYDPNEEPPPAKKKRKKTIRKKPAQPRTIVFKNNYDKNVAKALEALKRSVVSNKPIVPKAAVTAANDYKPKTQNKHTVESSTPEATNERTKQIEPRGSTCNDINAGGAIPTNQTANLTNEDKNYNSVRVEDIAADFDISMDSYNDIDYSPVNSPNCTKTPMEVNRHDIPQTSVHSKDPLNLRADLSFFGDNPIASSSMNISARHPEASPWRVEFNNLPIKWQANTYIKANMTPAVESSFINVEDKKKKHVYTNIMAEDNEPLPEMESNKSPYLKQTSIMSFIREVVERSAKKKNKTLIATPSKENSLFNHVANEPTGSIDKTPKNFANDSNVHMSSAEKIPSSSNDKETSNKITDYKKKVKSTPKDKNGTFFGFDDTEDQENVSPEKINNPKVRALRPRARAVLQEINAMSGPMRAELPIAARSKVTASSDAVNKVYEEIIAADAPIFPEKNNGEHEETNVDDATCNTDGNDHDSLSMHLFEDIELVHHLKPSRKSYSKAKKVTFHQQTSPTETLNLGGQAHESSDEDDLADLTFTMPSVQQKKLKRKPTKKQMMSKKEEQAMEAWAAGFNSMCEDIEEFPLVVE